MPSQAAQVVRSQGKQRPPNVINVVFDVFSSLASIPGFTQVLPCGARDDSHKRPDPIPEHNNKSNPRFFFRFPAEPRAPKFRVESVLLSERQQSLHFTSLGAKRGVVGWIWDLSRHELLELGERSSAW